MTARSSTLDEARRALYGGTRATFVERRKELAGAARRGGDRDEAKLIGEMRKPTAAAHLVNLLAQSDDRSLRELVELGASIRSAMATGSDAEMRSLLQGRAAAIANTLAQAKDIARASGESVSGAVGEQIVQILRAAMASDEAAEAVRGAALTDVLDEPGFEGVSIEPAARARMPKRSGERAPAPKRTGRKKPQPKAEVAVDRAADRAAERAAAARAAAQARIESIAAEVAHAEHALAATIERRDGLERDRERLAAQLAQIEDEVTEAQAALDDSRARLDDAQDDVRV